MAQNFHVARRHVGVSNVLGLHLRVANKFVQSANAFQSEVRVHCKGVTANGKSILSLLSLAAECGTMLALEAEGCDAEDAVAALADLISSQLQESEEQVGEKACRSPEPRPTKPPARAGGSPGSPRRSGSGRSWRCHPRWDSWRRGSTVGPGIESRTVSRGRWSRRGSRRGG
jgi:phosphocarrier protein